MSLCIGKANVNVQVLRSNPQQGVKFAQNLQNNEPEPLADLESVG